ncbi:tetratricopeptide repeat protein [Stenotrophomonas sp.]|uniref:tetratricopeptide repeat protein n=1 Tax=Stenotrophomonas sp. TaxID=69392 RepID=UPI0028A0276C|nr:tetratricopeptide repeat protein [Stenotrophomonas sp.]
MNVGDVITSPLESGEWHTIKLLAIDTWPDGDTFHCLCYRTTREKPTVDTLATLDVAVYHAPISADGFRQRGEILCSTAIGEDELVGFIEYLKMTDFARYLQVSGQNVEAVVSMANAHYRTACALDDSGQKVEAIGEYSSALDLFPLFFEALDNRGLTYLELGDVDAALDDFTQSLRINPSGSTAFAARGDCLLRLDQLEAAEQVFAEGEQRFPEHRAFHAGQLAKVRQRLRHRGATEISPSASEKKKGPWWKLWN